MLPFKDRNAFETDAERLDWDVGYADAINHYPFNDLASDAYQAGYDAGLYDLRSDR